MRVTSEGDSISITKGQKEGLLGPSSPARHGPTSTSHSCEPAGLDRPQVWFVSKSAVRHPETAFSLYRGNLDH